VNALRNMSANLHHLHLKTCDLGASSMKQLCGSLAYCSVLSTLELTNNHFGDLGAQNLSDLLAKNGSLSSLLVMQCGIGKKGLKALGLALQVRARPSSGLFELDASIPLSTVWAELFLPSFRPFGVEYCDAESGMEWDQACNQMCTVYSNEEILEYWWGEQEWQERCEAFCMSNHGRLGQVSWCSAFEDGLLQMILDYQPKPSLLPAKASPVVTYSFACISS